MPSFRHIPKDEVSRARIGPRSLKPPHSREYAIQTLCHLESLLEEEVYYRDKIEIELKKIEQFQHWKVLGYKTQDEFLRDELEDKLTALGKTRLDQVRLGKRGRPKKGEEIPANGRFSKYGSNSTTHIRARLARDHPAVLEALERGEYRSTRAAGIAAGIVKVPTALELLHRAWEKASEGERRAFLFDGPVSRVIAKLMEE